MANPNMKKYDLILLDKITEAGGENIFKLKLLKYILEELKKLEE